MKKIILLLFILFSCEEKIVVTEFTEYNNRTLNNLSNNSNNYIYYIIDNFSNKTLKDKELFIDNFKEKRNIKNKIIKSKKNITLVFYKKNYYKNKLNYEHDGFFLLNENEYYKESDITVTLSYICKNKSFYIENLQIFDDTKRKIILNRIDSIKF